jgi:hypothetical protein
MSRSLFIVLFSVAILASYMTLYEAFNNSEPTRAETSTETETRSEPEATWPQITSRQPAALTITPATQEITSENPEIAEVREQLQQQARRLDQLRRIRAERLQQTRIINPYLLNQKTYNLEEIESRLEETRFSQTVLNQNIQQAIELQSQQNQIARDDLDYTIRELAENIKNIQLQFDYNISVPPEINTGIAKEQYFIELRNTLAAQIEQINALRAQRANLPADFTNRNQFLQMQTQILKSDLSQQQFLLQEQILEIRNDIRDIQESNRQMNMSLAPLEQQIEQAEKDYQSVSEKLNSLRQR